MLANVAGANSQDLSAGRGLVGPSFEAHVSQSEIVKSSAEMILLELTIMPDGGQRKMLDCSLNQSIRYQNSF